jgi:hypothetical protein
MCLMVNVGIAPSGRRLILCPLRHCLIRVSIGSARSLALLSIVSLAYMRLSSSRAPRPKWRPVRCHDHKGRRLFDVGSYFLQADNAVPQPDLSQVRSELFKIANYIGILPGWDDHNLTSVDNGACHDNITSDAILSLDTQRALWETARTHAPAKAATAHPIRASALSLYRSRQIDGMQHQFWWQREIITFCR